MSAPGGRAVELDVRDNALNLLRLVLALAVLLSHGFLLGGFGEGWGFRGESIGGWAVFGFFAISGYLITASRFANPLPRYLALRIARIYPAFVVCLIVTAGVFAPLGWWAEGRAWAGFWPTDTTPVHYVLGNLGLRMTTFDVGGTPAAVPYPRAWDGSLWTLFPEFCSYVVVGLLVTVPLVRRRRWLVGVAWAVSVVIWLTRTSWSPSVAPDALDNLLKLLPVFLGGALLHVVRNRVPLRVGYAAVATVVTALLLWALGSSGPQLAAPLIAYVLLWLSTVIRSPRVVQRHDISYGAYIYAFPVLQLLAYAGAPRWGLLANDLLAVAGTTVLATLSWRLVERPTLRAVRHRLDRGRPSTSGPRDQVVTQRAHLAPAPVRERPRHQGERMRP